MATDSGVVAVCTDTTIPLELQQFENYRLKNYSTVLPSFLAVFLNVSMEISWNSDLQRDNPGSDRLSLTFPLQQSEQVALRHLLNEVGLVPFICVKDKITKILA